VQSQLSPALANANQDACGTRCIMNRRMCSSSSSSSSGRTTFSPGLLQNQKPADTQDTGLQLGATSSSSSSSSSKSSSI
jgi:hypothetical protein